MSHLLNLSVCYLNEVRYFYDLAFSAIILYLLQLCHQLYQQNCWLINFICRYVPLKQWAFDDSHSPKYQKFKVDQLPKIVYHHQDWDWKPAVCV